MISRNNIRRPLHLKLMGVLLVFLLFVVGLTAINAHLSVRLQGLGGVINDAGSERMRLYRILYLGFRGNGPALQPSQPDATLGRRQFREEVERFQQILHGFREGGSLYHGYRPGPRCRAALDALSRTWEVEIRPLLDRAAAGGDPRAAQEALRRYEARVPGYVAAIDRYVKMIEEEAAGETALLGRVQWVFLFMALGLVGFAAVAAYRGIYRPVQTMLDGMGRMERGEFRPPIPAASEDEIGKLAQGLNALGEKLEKAYRGLEHQLDRKTEQVQRQETRIIWSREREYFVRLLHDEIAQRILFLLMQARVLREKLAKTINPLTLPSPPRGRGFKGDGGSFLEKAGDAEKGFREEMDDRLRRLVETLHATHQEVRRALTGLIAENENENENENEERHLLARLRKYLSEFEELNDIRVALNVESWPEFLPPVHEAVLYGAVREGVVNAYKYAGARGLWVSLAGDGDLLKLIVRDDGRDPKGIASPSGEGGSGQSPFLYSSHMGLRILGNRIQEIGGILNVVHPPEGGTTLTVVLPFAASP